MDHTVLIDRFFRDQGLRVTVQWNCFQTPYDHQLGWPLSLPQVDWCQTDFLVLVFQDFVTMQQGTCVELLRVEQTYQSHCDRVIVLHWPHALAKHYHGPVRLVEFNAHEYVILNNLRTCQLEWQQVWYTGRDRAWQCLNGRKCHHRLRVVQHLEETWQGGTVSLGDTVPLPQYPYSTYRGTSNEDNWQRLIPLYGRHHFNIVTETQYDQNPGIITEKTIFALLAAQIPIVIGYAGIVRDCEALGFDMFTDIVDTSYDNLPNETRWQAALDLNRDIVTNYRATASVTQRLLDQAQRLIQQWPESHMQQALQQIQYIIDHTGLQ